MKITVTESMFVDHFRAIRPENFSPAALRALFEYYEEIEAGNDEEMELDVVAICCDWTEYKTASEAASAYDWEPDADASEEENEHSALEYLQDKTSVLATEESFIILNF